MLAKSLMRKGEKEGGVEGRGKESEAAKLGVGEQRGRDGESAWQRARLILKLWWEKKFWTCGRWMVGRLSAA